MNLTKLLSLAFVMIVGPQILCAIFLATTENWPRNTLAFIVGAGVSITTAATIAFLLSAGASNQGASSNTLEIIALVLLVGAAVHTLLTRKQSEPPKWMGKLEAAQPKTSFKLGFLLLGVFPTDILTSFAVGSYVSSHNEPWWSRADLRAVDPVIPRCTVAADRRLRPTGSGFSAEGQDWMNNNSWVVSEIVLALFIVLTASSLAA